VKFDDIQGVVCDMDGVLWRGSEPLPGMTDFFALMHEINMPLMLATNNSSRSPAMYVDKLRGMGVETIAEANIINSGLATVNYLLSEYPIGADVHVFGGDGLHTVIADAGFNLVERGADVVVVGLKFDLTYDEIKAAVLNIRAGARFIATNPDPTFPAPEGLIPGAGSVVAAVQVASDVTPKVIGKPHAPMFQYALQKLGTAPAATLMIGDRISTDIEGGHNAGMQTALVFTGVTQPDDLIDSDIQPTIAYEGLDALVKAWHYAGGKRRR
jgi:4-nitrophenyl phosphatase